VLDQDKSQESREFIGLLERNNYFKIKYYVNNQNEIDNLINSDKIMVCIVIPHNFSKDILNGNQTEIQALINGTNSNTAGIIAGYVNAFVNNYSQSIRLSYFKKVGMKEDIIPLDYRPRVWYNSELKSVKFLLPGLIGFILLISTVISTALSVVREKEKRNIENIIVSPIRSFEWIIGKLIPYLFVSLITATLVITVGIVLFGIVIKGSIFWLFIATLVYVTAGLGWGLLISTVAESQQVAFMMAMLTTLLPSMILSGFVFPIESMPWIIQKITYIIPTRYFLVILRGIILKGAGILPYIDQFIYMCIFTASVLILSSVRLKKWRI
jgi:ABC-2 type transport system permease protein